MAARDGYHHGNLRRALMDEALAVVAEHGVGGLSLRDIASRLGVSHAAPYHHFADKSALLRSLAFEGMSVMDIAMEQAESLAGDDPGDRLLGIGLAYACFAVEHPEYYAAMTAPELGATAAPQSEEPAEEHGHTWERLFGAVTACQRAGALPQGDPVVLSVAMWSVVHGMVELWRSGPLSLMPQAAGGFEPFARQVLLAALGSMRSAPAERTP